MANKKKERKLTVFCSTMDRKSWGRSQQCACVVSMLSIFIYRGSAECFVIYLWMIYFYLPDRVLIYYCYRRHIGFQRWNTEFQRQTATARRYTASTNNVCLETEICGGAEQTLSKLVSKLVNCRKILSMSRQLWRNAETKISAGL